MDYPEDFKAAIINAFGPDAFSNIPTRKIEEIFYGYRPSQYGRIAGDIPQLIDHSFKNEYYAVPKEAVGGAPGMNLRDPANKALMQQAGQIQGVEDINIAGTTSIEEAEDAKFQGWEQLYRMGALTEADFLNTNNLAGLPGYREDIATGKVPLYKARREFGTEEEFWEDIKASIAARETGYNPTETGNIGSIGLDRPDDQGNLNVQSRSSGGQFGRKLTGNEQFREDLERVLIYCFMENYERLHVGSAIGTGTLREAVEQGTLEVDAEGASFKYTIADLERHRERSADVSTHIYGPVIFKGRDVLQATSAGGMTFRGYGRFAGRIINKYQVKGVQAKNIFILTERQKLMIDEVIVKGITPTIKEILSGQFGSSRIQKRSFA